MGYLPGVLAFAVLAALAAGGSCASNVPPGPDITTDYGQPYLPAKATWYGQPTGSGPDDNGGACGIKDVNLAPYNGMIACGNLPIFKDGKGCGSCFQIRCTNHSACSRKPVGVIITDMNYELLSPYRFDLSGKSFGAMAKSGREQELRSAGMIDLQFRRVRCQYAPGTKIVFHVEKGSHANYLAVLVKFVAHEGTIVQMEIREKRSKQWKPMEHSWGVIWRVDRTEPLVGPFSFRLTTESGRKRIAHKVIPAGWTAGTTYKSDVQF
ncbi:hypothetical protein ZWY2020_013125 [Hordeum vulgare]|nr:hypothetical protein ZWY2020_013125 [Hordeum vulgare]